MASSSQVHTLHDHSEPSGVQSNHASQGATNGRGKTSAEPDELPSPQAAPAEPPKPLSDEDWKKTLPKPSKKANQERQKELDAYQVWLDYKKDKTNVENKSKREGGQTIFDGQDIRNKDEAVQDWLDELYLVMRTEAPQAERRAAYDCE